MIDIDVGLRTAVLADTCLSVGRPALLASGINYSNGNLVLPLPMVEGGAFSPLPEVTYNSIFPTASEFGYGWSGGSKWGQAANGDRSNF